MNKIVGSGVVLVVDLEKPEVKQLKLPEKFVQLYGGGRGFNSRILYEFRKFAPNVENVVIISPGLLTGSKFPSTSRVTVSVLNSAVSKRFSDSSLGGFFASYFRATGCACLVIKGISKIPVLLELDNNRLEFKSVPADWENMTVPEISSDIRENYDTKYASISKKRYTPPRRWKGLVNGISGRNQVWCSGLFCDQRLVAAAGAGKAFGLMNVRAVLVPEDPDAFREPEFRSDTMAFAKVTNTAIDKIKDHPVYRMFSKFGTTSLVEIHSALKYFPSYNFNLNTFDGWKKISGKANFSEGIGWRKKREKLNADGLLNCRECPIQCSAPNRMEYEGLQGLGAKIGSDDLKFIQKMNKWFEVVGADLIQPTGVLSAVMDMNIDGVLTMYAYDTREEGHGREHDPPIVTFWGDTHFAEEFLNGLMLQDKSTPIRAIGCGFKDGFNEGLAQLTSEGRIHLSMSIKEANLEYFVAIKNMALSGVMPSLGHKGVAVAIASSTRGADHLRSLPTLASYASWYLKSMRVKRIIDMFKISWSALSIMKAERSNLVKSLYPNYVRRFGVPKYVADEWEEHGFLFAEEDDYRGHARMIWFTQAEYAAADCFGQCRFTTCWRFGIGPGIVAEAGTLMSGHWYDEKSVMEMGERVYAIERELLFMYGEQPADDRLPAKFFGKAWSISKEGFKIMMDEYYERCGYDSTGRPTPETMHEFVLDPERGDAGLHAFLQCIVSPKTTV